MKWRIAIGILALGLVAAACSSDDSADTTTTAAPTTTTTEATTTTTQATTTTAAPTTTEATTTTAAPAGAVIEATPIVAQLQPYNAEGAELFPAGSVEAHWYQWDGLYIVLYRGFDASDGSPICAGNSIQESSGFSFISNSPHNATAEEICDGVPKLAEEPSGVYACGALLYSITEIPVGTEGNLFGTLEIVRDNGTSVAGQTSAVAAVTEATPQFEPGLSVYELPAVAVDDLTTVACG